MSSHRTMVRLTLEDEAEAFCWGCHEWYAIKVEFWPDRRSFTRCRACENERKRLYMAQRLLDPEHRLTNIEKSRRYREYVRSDPTLWDIYVRERRLKANERHRQMLSEQRDRWRAYQREWQRRKRAALREARAA